MTDYHSPTVVTPNLPIADITPLERLLLGLVFDADQDDDYFQSWCGPSDIVTLPVEELRAACEESRHVPESTIAARVDVLLAEFDAASEDPGDDIDVDITRPDTGWERMFQDIVRRSATIDEVVVTTAFTCSEMRPDGFGGSVMRISADLIRYASTMDMVEKMSNTAAPQTVPVAVEDGERLP